MMRDDHVAQPVGQFFGEALKSRELLFEHHDAERNVPEEFPLSGVFPFDIPVDLAYLAYVMEKGADLYQVPVDQAGVPVGKLRGKLHGTHRVLEEAPDVTMMDHQSR